MSPQVLDKPDNANVEVHPPLVDNPSSNAKVKVVVPIQNPSGNVKFEVLPPQLDIPFGDAKVGVAPQVEIPSVNANSKVPSPEVNLSIYHLGNKFTTKRKIQSRDE